MGRLCLLTSIRERVCMCSGWSLRSFPKAVRRAAKSRANWTTLKNIQALLKMQACEVIPGQCISGVLPSHCRHGGDAVVDPGYG